MGAKGEGWAGAGARQRRRVSSAPERARAGRRWTEPHAIGAAAAACPRAAGAEARRVSSRTRLRPRRSRSARAWARPAVGRARPWARRWAGWKEARRSAMRVQLASAPARASRRGRRHHEELRPTSTAGSVNARDQRRAEAARAARPGRGHLGEARGDEYELAGRARGRWVHTC